jgi:hypothetical protein
VQAAPSGGATGGGGPASSGGPSGAGVPGGSGPSGGGGPGGSGPSGGGGPGGSGPSGGGGPGGGGPSGGGAPSPQPAASGGSRPPDIEGTAVDISDTSGAAGDAPTPQAPSSAAPVGGAVAPSPADVFGAPQHVRPPEWQAAMSDADRRSRNDPPSHGTLMGAIHGLGDEQRARFFQATEDRLDTTSAGDLVANTRGWLIDQQVASADASQREAFATLAAAPSAARMDAVTGYQTWSQLPDDDDARAQQQAEWTVPTPQPERTE